MIDPGNLYDIVKNTLVTLYDTVSYDNMNTLLTTINTHMNSKKPTIIYFHCSAGIDRTGYVSGAYKMKYHSWTLK